MGATEWVFLKPLTTDHQPLTNYQQLTKIHQPTHQLVVLKLCQNRRPDSKYVLNSITFESLHNYLFLPLTDQQIIY